MRQFPLPDNLKGIILGFEVDVPLEQMHYAFVHRTLEEIQLFVRARGWEERVIRKPYGGPDACFLLRQKDRAKAPRLEQVKRIRKILSTHIGLDPASFYSFIPEHFDEEFLRKYRYSFSTMCRHGGRECIRPSHLVPCTYFGKPLR